MGSTATQAKQAYVGNARVCYRPTQRYLVATGAHVIFQITGGAIVATSLYGTLQAVGAADVRLRITANAINTDSGVQDLTTAGVVGSIFISELDVATAPIFSGAVAGGATKTVATAGHMAIGTLAGGIGNITATFTTGGAGDFVDMDFTLVYYAMSPRVRVWALGS
jgi:hypothetical protein